MNTIPSEPVFSEPDVSVPLATEPPYRLRRIFLALLLAVALTDLCFWQVNGVGFSFGLFFLALALAILSSRAGIRWTGRLIALLALLAGASFAAMIECGVANAIVLIVLTAAIAGESYFTSFEPMWARLYAQVGALLLAPARPFWLAARVNGAIYDGKQGRFRRCSSRSTSRNFSTFTAGRPITMWPFIKRIMGMRWIGKSSTRPAPPRGPRCGRWVSLIHPSLS
jgi:hypothetical protein